MPRSLLARNADVLVTMDADRREIRNGGLLIEGNRIVAVGPSDNCRRRPTKSSTSPAMWSFPA